MFLNRHNLRQKTLLIHVILNCFVTKSQNNYHLIIFQEICLLREPHSLSEYLRCLAEVTSIGISVVPDLTNGEKRDTTVQALHFL